MPKTMGNQKLKKRNSAYSFIDYLTFLESNFEKRTLTFVDVDDTLFTTNARIVVKDKKSQWPLRALSAKEFNTYLPKENEIFDFSQFESAEIFRKTSKPIQEMIDRLNSMFNEIETKNSGSQIILLTARGNFDNKEEFLATFKDWNIDVSKFSNIIFLSDSLKQNSFDKPVAEKKKFVINNYLERGEFSRVRLYDDSEENLSAFLSLKSKYSTIAFTAFKVNPDTGKINKFT